VAIEYLGAGKGGLLDKENISPGRQDYLLGPGESEYCRMFKELNIRSAHRSRYLRCDFRCATDRFGPSTIACLIPAPLATVPAVEGVAADRTTGIIPNCKIIDRHCERSEAIQSPCRGFWIASSASPPRNDESVILQVGITPGAAQSRQLPEKESCFILPAPL
jgi:hypothetical protein